MSYELGWSALNMEMTNTVPRTEYSAANHWELVRRVTGMDTSKTANRPAASQAFMKAWDYSFNWSIAINRVQIAAKGPITDMGHAEYQESVDGTSDYRDHVEVAYPDPDIALNLDIPAVYGEFSQAEIIAIYEKAYANSCENNPDLLNMSGIYVNPVSGILEIFGWDTFLMMMGMDIKRFNKVMAGYCEWLDQFYRAFCESNVPVFMCHDDICWTSGPFADPEWYRAVVFPHYKKWFDMLHAAGKKIMFTSDGNYTAFFDDIVKCGADMLVMEPTSDMAGFAAKYGKTHGFVGNVDVRILQFGTREDIRKEVQRAMDIGKKYPGFIFCTGNHIPPNVPVDNAIYYNDCYMEMRNR